MFYLALHAGNFFMHFCNLRVLLFKFNLFKKNNLRNNKIVSKSSGLVGPDLRSKCKSACISS